jgi:hypothetical protein
MSTATRQTAPRSPLASAVIAFAVVLLASLVWLLAGDPADETAPPAGARSATKEVPLEAPITPAPAVEVAAPAESVESLPLSATAEAEEPAIVSDAKRLEAQVLADARPSADTGGSGDAATSTTNPKSDACVRTALALAEHSPVEALRWALAQPPEDAGAAVIAAAYEVSRAQPLEALNALTDLPPSDERNMAVIYTASQWASLESKPAAEWVRKFPPGILRDWACSAVAIAMAEHEPWQAADFAATEIADGVQLRTTAVAVAQRWAQRQPAAAAAWAEKFPEGPLRDDIIREIDIQRSMRGVSR